MCLNFCDRNFFFLIVVAEFLQSSFPTSKRRGLMGKVGVKTWKSLRRLQ